MLVRVQCACGTVARNEVDRRGMPEWLDPRALVLKLLARQGWAYRNGRISKGVIDAVCPRCRARGTALFLEADFLPTDAVAATYAEDLAIIPLDDAGGDAHDGAKEESHE